MGKNPQRQDDTQKVIQDIGQGAKSTVKLQVKLVKKLWTNTIGAIWVRFWNATLLGKVFVLLGFLFSAAIVYLAFAYGINWNHQEQESIVVSTGKANVRESVSTKSKIIRSVRRGEKLERKGEADEWWFVQGEKWDSPGWVSKKVARLEKSEVVIIEYQARGYVWLLLIGLAVMYLGFCLRKGPLLPRR